MLSDPLMVYNEQLIAQEMATNGAPSSSSVSSFLLEETFNDNPISNVGENGQEITSIERKIRGKEIAENSDDDDDVNSSRKRVERQIGITCRKEGDGEEDGDAVVHRSHPLTRIGDFNSSTTTNGIRLDVLTNHRLSAGKHSRWFPFNEILFSFI